MKQPILLTFILLTLVFTNSAFSQKYTTYLTQGKSFYQSKNYFSAFERFVLANEFANTEIERNEAKKWQERSKEKILQQQNLLSSSVKNIETILRYTLKGTGSNQDTKLYKLCKNKGVTELKNRNFYDAYNYFKLAKLSPDYVNDSELEKYIIKSKSLLNSTKKIALVIGNANYPNQKLPKATIDAKDVAQALKSIGFKVIAVLNADTKQMNLQLSEFMKQSKEYDIALFYFSGFSYQSDFLLPVDASSSDQDRSNKWFSVNYLMSKFPKGDSKKIFILDVDRSSHEGVVNSVMAYDDFIVCHSTSPNGKAYNGKGRNAIFTQHLLKELTT